MTYEPPRIERRRPLAGRLMASISQTDASVI